MSSVTLRSPDNRVMRFRKVNEHHTDIRSGWDRSSKGIIFWDGTPKTVARSHAVAYYRQLLANNWKPVAYP